MLVHHNCIYFKIFFQKRIYFPISYERLLYKDYTRWFIHISGNHSPIEFKNMKLCTYPFKLTTLCNQVPIAINQRPFITNQHEPDFVAYNKWRVGGEQETTSVGDGSSTWNRFLLTSPFLLDAQTGSDHVGGVTANLVRFPSQAVIIVIDISMINSSGGRTRCWKTFTVTIRLSTHFECKEKVRTYGYFSIIFSPIFFLIYL